jgi:hypothetical protein
MKPLLLLSAIILLGTQAQAADLNELGASEIRAAKTDIPSAVPVKAEKAPALAALVDDGFKYKYEPKFRDAWDDLAILMRQILAKEISQEEFDKGVDESKLKVDPVMAEIRKGIDKKDLKPLKNFAHFYNQRKNLFVRQSLDILAADDLKKFLEGKKMNWREYLVDAAEAEEEAGDVE